jgi:hypothetical protein
MGRVSNGPAFLSAFLPAMLDAKRNSLLKISRCYPQPLFRELLPVIAKVEFPALIEDLWGNPQKDNFHKLIFDIDKIAVFGIINSTRLIALSLSQRGWSMEKDL